jgi:hypothetical protein
MGAMGRYVLFCNGSSESTIHATKILKHWRISWVHRESASHFAFGIANSFAIINCRATSSVAQRIAVSVDIDRLINGPSLE